MAAIATKCFGRERVLPLAPLRDDKTSIGSKTIPEQASQ